MKNEINVNLFAQQIQQINWRLAELYKGATIAPPKEPELLPVAFKELGIASETLQVALEELRQQNEELVAARQALEAERHRYQDLFELAPQGYLVTDAEGTIREANRAAAKLLNVSPEFLVGKPFVIFIPQEERRIFRNELTRLHEQQRVYELTVRLQPRKGEIFDAGITVATTHNNGEGKAVTLRWLIRDITERKRVEKALEKNNYDLKQDRPVQAYSKGEIIPLDPQNLWLVCRGLVKLSTMSDNCEEVLVGLVGPSMPFGSCLTALSTYQATAVSDVQIVNISLSEITASPHLAQTILPKINLRLRQTESLLAISGQRRLQDRLQNLLLLLKQEVGEPVPQGTRLSVRLTHQDLANACCVTRVTITRLLGKLQQEGKISFDSKYHIILKEGSF
ncbi:PAS domain S-box protein [Coleofasciculus sp. FACHB-64]|uniref:PAS domain S-box protein n=1 Tax=Cyanophyceae TaxID=3028117 RepID=UPI0018F04393|nr:PAS domain S-box protein [Coleofasciculus sp. FACHB-64]